MVLFADFMKNQKVSNKAPVIPTGIALTLFEKHSGHAVTKKCSETIEYPAVVAGIQIIDDCIKARERSWLERIFGN